MLSVKLLSNESALLMLTLPSITTITLYRLEGSRSTQSATGTGTGTEQFESPSLQLVTRYLEEKVKQVISSNPWLAGYLQRDSKGTRLNFEQGWSVDVNNHFQVVSDYFPCVPTDEFACNSFHEDPRFMKYIVKSGFD